MASLYTIADAEHLLKVKVHVIRYWEKEMPLIQPDKGARGRRIYSGRDLQIFFRLKYLLYDRRFTLEGAREQIYRELAGDYQDLRGQISALRSQLLDLYFAIKREETP
jgi:DNA-binding transcriptional MerR regulator